MDLSSFIPGPLQSIPNFTTWLNGLGVPSAVTGPISTGLGGIMHYASTVGAILTFIGLARIGPDISIRMGGPPVLKQLKGMDVLKNVIGTAKEITQGIEKAAKGVSDKLRGIQNAASSLNALTASTDLSQTTLNMTNNPTRFNPHAQGLLELLTICNTASFTSTNILTTNTGGPVILAAVQAAWEPVREKLGNSGTYYVTLAYTKALTDIYCELVPDSGVITLAQAIEITSDTSDDLSVLFGFTATVGTFVGTLFNTGTITSATTSIRAIAALSTSTTTIVATITGLEADADLYSQNLLNQMALDVENQAKYKSQANNISAIAQSASALAMVQKTHTKEVQALFLSTINPAYVGAVTDMKDLLDLSSPNTATQAQALANIIAATTGT